MTHAVDRSGDWKARLYARGFELFNAGKRFEAHEEWETLWLDEPKGHPNRLFLQGLIQVAAAFHRVDTHFLRAAYRLFRSARRKLIPFAPSYKGVDVAALVPRIEAWIERLGAPDRTDAPSHAEDFPIACGGRGWNEPGREAETSAGRLSAFRAFEQYSSDREVRASCPECGAGLAVNGRRRAPAEDAERAWTVACPGGCVVLEFAGAR